MVVALYQIEDETLSLIELGDQEVPKSFEAAKDQGLGRYDLQKIQLGISLLGVHPKPNEPKTGGQKSPKGGDGAPALN